MFSRNSFAALNLLRKGNSSSAVGLAAIALAAFLWAAAAVVASNLFQAGITPMVLATLRSVIAAIGLAILTRIWQQPQKLFNWRLLGLGLSLALVTVSYYFAIARLSVAVALVIQYTAPVLVVLWVAARSRQMPSLPMLIAVLAAFTGVTLVSGLFLGQLQLNPTGLIPAVLSALFFASYTLFSESLVGTYGAMGVMSRGFLVSGLFWLAAIAPQTKSAALLVPANFLGIAFVSIGGTLLPFCLFCWGIQQVRADRGVIAATLEPVIGAVLAWLWLGQTLNFMQIVGGVLVIAAVLSLQLLPAKAQ